MRQDSLGSELVRPPSCPPYHPCRPFVRLAARAKFRVALPALETPAGPRAGGRFGLDKSPSFTRAAVGQTARSRYKRAKMVDSRQCLTTATLARMFPV